MLNLCTKRGCKILVETRTPKYSFLSRDVEGEPFEIDSIWKNIVLSLNVGGGAITSYSYLAKLVLSLLFAQDCSANKLTGLKPTRLLKQHQQENKVAWPCFNYRRNRHRRLAPAKLNYCLKINNSIISSLSLGRRHKIWKTISVVGHCLANSVYSTWSKSHYFS